MGTRILAHSFASALAFISVILFQRFVIYSKRKKYKRLIHEIENKRNSAVMNSTSLISPSSFPFSANSFRAKKILIVHASVGAGHKRCAEALEAALKELGSPVIIKTIDILDYSAKGFALMYKEMYLQLVQKLWGQYLVGYFYEHSNHSVAVSKLKQKLKLNVEKSFFLSFLELIYDFNPDIVVNTHFLAAEIIADLRKKEHVFIPQVTVVTDFDAHFFCKE